MNFLHRLAYAWPNHFWAVWGLGLCIAVGVPLWMAGRWPSARSPSDKSRSGAAVLELPSPLGALSFAAFVVAYVGFMLWGEDFTYKDGHSFTDFSAIGKLRPPAIWPSSGRFWPLGYQEYNLIAHVSPTATAYLLYGAFQLLVALWLLYLALPRERPSSRLFLFAVLMLAPAFGAVFAELTYADRNVVFAICVLVFAVARYDRDPARSWLALAIAASYCALFYKETSVALLAGFAALRLLTQLRRHGWHGIFTSALEVGMLLGCGCFAIELGLTLLPAGTSSYVDELSIGRLAAALRYLKADPLLVGFLLAWGFHLVRLLQRRAELDLLWDALAAGAVLHFVAVSSTGVAETYLLGPTELVAGSTLLRLVAGWWRERQVARPILASLCVGIVSASAAFGTFRLIQRKHVVWQTQKIAEFVISYYRSPGVAKTRLYLPADEGVAMDFVSFLSYRGLSFARHGEVARGNVIDVAGPALFEGDRCVGFSDLICRHDLPRAGDLVVRLPEEAWSPVPGVPSHTDAELGLHLAAVEPLFQASPAVLVSALRPVLSLLYRVSPTLTGLFPRTGLPDDWLRVSAIRVRSASEAPRP